jgi:curved DNA-binding protein CbpA
MVSASDKNGNYYALLGLTPNASDEEIRDAYYELAKAYHPDKRKHDEKAEEAFRAIARAAAILRDPERRSLYDRGIIGEATDLAVPREAPSRNGYGRAVLVFLATLIMTSVVGAGLSVIVLKKVFESSRVANNQLRQAETSRVAEASLRQGELKHTSTHPPQPLSSGVARDSSEVEKPSSSEDRPDHSSVSERTADAREGSLEKPAPPGVPFKNEDDLPSRSASTFGLPAFDVSPGNGKPSPTKLFLVRETNSRSGKCSLAQAAKDILLHVSAAIRAR